MEIRIPRVLREMISKLIKYPGYCQGPQVNYKDKKITENFNTLGIPRLFIFHSVDGEFRLHIGEAVLTVDTSFEVVNKTEPNFLVQICMYEEKHGKFVPLFFLAIVWSQLPTCRLTQTFPNYNSVLKWA